MPPDPAAPLEQETRHEAAARIAGALDAIVTGRPDDIDVMLDGIEGLPLSETLSAWQWLAQEVVAWAAEAGLRTELTALMDTAALPARIRPVLREAVATVPGVDAVVADGPLSDDEIDDVAAVGVGETIGACVLVLLELVRALARATGVPEAGLVRALPAYGETVQRPPASPGG